MSLFEKAKELGQEIKESPEFKAVIKASQNIQDDAEAQKIIQDVQAFQQQIELAEQEGMPLDQEQIGEYNDLKSQMESNILITAYFEAQENYGRLMQEVNQTIQDQIYDE